MWAEDYNLELPADRLLHKKKILIKQTEKIDCSHSFIEKGIQLFENTGKLSYIAERFFKQIAGKEFKAAVDIRERFTPHL